MSFAQPLIFLNNLLNSETDFFPGFYLKFIVIEVHTKGKGVKSGEHSGDTGMWPVSQILSGERGEKRRPGWSWCGVGRGDCGCILPPQESASSLEPLCPGPRGPIPCPALGPVSLLLPWLVFSWQIFKQDNVQGLTPNNPTWWKYLCEAEFFNWLLTLNGHHTRSFFEDWQD